MTIRTIHELIDFIDTNNLENYEQINSLCDAMFNKKFCHVQISGTSYSKYYFLHHLRDFANDLDKGINERTFINTPYPFSIKDIFN